MSVCKIKPERQAKLRKAFMEGKSKTQAMREAGYPESSIKGQCHISKGIMDIQEEVAETYREQVLTALDKMGIDASKYASKLGELLECGRIILSEDGNRERVTDNTNQIRALIELGDILGVKAPKEFEIKVEQLSVEERENRLARIKNRLLIGVN